MRAAGRTNVWTALARHARHLPQNGARSAPPPPQRRLAAAIGPLSEPALGICPLHPSSPTHPGRRHWLAAALASPSGVGAARGQRAPADERAPASSDGIWHDTARQRELRWRARWPAGTAPCAVVLYSHGLGGSREGGDAWGEAWCGSGIAVLHLQHAGSDSEALRGGGWQALRDAASATQLTERVRDMRFAMDEVTRRAAAAEGPWARVRIDALGVAGHSFGAHTTQALAGQRFAAAAAAPFEDPRPRAFIALSPAPGRGASRLPAAEAFGAVTRPFLSVTGSLDADPFPGRERGRGDGEFRTEVHRGLPPAQRALLWLDGADHMSFAGNHAQRIRSSAFFKRERVAEDNEARHHALVATITTLWWRARLLGDADAARALAAPAGLGPRDRFEVG